MSKYAQMRRRERLLEEPSLVPTALYMKNEGMAYAQENPVGRACLSLSLRLSVLTTVVVIVIFVYYLFTLFHGIQHATPASASSKDPFP